MHDQELSRKIIALQEADLAFRDHLVQTGQLGEGYHPEMLHRQNAAVLHQIIQQIGYPTSEKVGEAASEAAWLVIQHAIGTPSFMRYCAALLEDAVQVGKASALRLAYLQDRIAVFEGRPQHYGTQFDWDENGQLSPNPFDDLKRVNQRRKTLGMNTLEEQTELIRAQARRENHQPPSDPMARKKAFEAWRKEVGWAQG